MCQMTTKISKATRLATSFVINGTNLPPFGGIYRAVCFVVSKKENGLEGISVVTAGVVM